MRHQNGFEFQLIGFDAADLGTPTNQPTNYLFVEIGIRNFVFEKQYRTITVDRIICLYRRNVFVEVVPWMLL